jgi:hypothetical protein
VLAADAVLWIVTFSPILVALIGGGLAVALRAFDRRNTQQHADNQAVLLRIEAKVDHVVDRVSDHIDWHAHNGYVPPEVQISTIVQKEAQSHERNAS